MGGSSGKKGRNLLLSGGKKKILGSKENFKVQPGDTLRIETPGGGGYGQKT
ncbi:MAG: hydantoinase B/oxoprolinase family protein [Candidatus Aminicenantes bacterium]|nr:hydantoinase B/oxoprolinase family protein [Candidatus Aminicenantes bacterium]